MLVAILRGVGAVVVAVQMVGALLRSERFQGASPCDRRPQGGRRLAGFPGLALPS